MHVVCHHLPRLCISTSHFPAAVLRMEDWGAHGNFLLQLCNLDQRLAWIQVVTLIFAAQVHTSLQTLAVSQWQQFCRSLKCFEDHRNATVLLLELWNKILPSQTRPEASLEEQERAVLKPVRGSEFIRECQVSGRAKLRKCIYDLTWLTVYPQFWFEHLDASCMIEEKNMSENNGAGNPKLAGPGGYRKTTGFRWNSWFR